MTDKVRIEVPLNREDITFLKAGDNVLVSGTLYTGMEAGQHKMLENLKKGEGLHFDLRNQMFYFAGQTPAKPGEVIGSVGPNDYCWIDEYFPMLLKQGLSGVIGKGFCSKIIVDAIKECGAVLFGAIGGIGAYMSKRIVSADVIAYPELGTEAVHRIQVKDFPVIVIVDSLGNNLYESAKAQYRKT